MGSTGSEGSMGSTGSAGAARRIKIGKRRGVLIALRAHRHFERSPQSLLQNAHRLMRGNTRTSFFLSAYALIPAVQ